jgi:hypothetical protein
MRKRYHCPRHSEATPSAVVYGDTYHCFGCGSRGPVTELGLSAGEAQPEYVEDVKASIENIQSLPKRNIRGFDLHYNARGYYLLWPNFSYYKFRSFDDNTGGGKYRGPSGVKKTPFVLGNNGGTVRGDRLVLVEGEFNALSLASLEIPDLYIVSPGGAGDFYSKNSERYLQDYLKFSSIDIVVDNDAPGLLAGIEMKSKLAAKGADAYAISIVLVDKDFNEVHEQHGKEALRKYVTDLGLCGRVQDDE